jgi:hypothetical protein
VRTITVVTPDGTTWQVRVVWLPRWRALARRFGGWRRRRREGREEKSGWDLPDVGASDELLVVVAVVVGMVVFGLLFWFLLLPLLLLALDILVVLMLLVLAIPARVLLRRPWSVEAVEISSGHPGQQFHTQVVGWRRALAVRDEIARQLQKGRPTPVI